MSEFATVATAVRRQTMKLVRSILAAGVIAATGCSRLNTQTTHGFSETEFHRLTVGVDDEGSVLRKLGPSAAKWYDVAYPNGSSNIVDQPSGECKVINFTHCYSAPKAEKADFIRYDLVFSPDGILKAKEIKETD